MTILSHSCTKSFALCSRLVFVYCRASSAAFAAGELYSFVTEELLLLVQDLTRNQVISDLSVKP